MSGFHLGNALSQAVFSQFKQLGIDAEAIRNLSPRFKTAAQFAERNYQVRQDVFTKHLPGLSIEQIVERLNQNDETVIAQLTKYTLLQMVALFRLKVRNRLKSL